MENLCKNSNVKSDDKVIKLKADRSLLARMLVVSKSRPQISVKEASDHHEFNLFKDHCLPLTA